jgi:hypothetical protein
MRSSFAVGDKFARRSRSRGRVSITRMLPRMLLPAALFAVALVASLSAPAHGQTLQSKIASDLQPVP